MATGGLVLAILGVRRAMAAAVPFAVGLWITAAYWFTASTSFANPAVTLARSLTDTFAGIAPGDAPAFIAAQFAAALGAAAFWGWMPRSAHPRRWPCRTSGPHRRPGRHAASRMRRPSSTRPRQPRLRRRHRSDATGWPDIIVASAMAALGLTGGWQIVRQSLAEVQYERGRLAAAE